MDRRTFLLKRGTIVLAAISSLSFPSITKAYNRNPTIRVPRYTRDATGGYTPASSKGAWNQYRILSWWGC